MNVFQRKTASTEDKAMNLRATKPLIIFVGVLVLSRPEALWGVSGQSTQEAGQSLAAVGIHADQQSPESLRFSGQTQRSSFSEGLQPTKPGATSLLAQRFVDPAPEVGRPPRFRASPSSSTLPQARTIPKDDAEKQILAVLDEINRTQGRWSMSVPEEDGRLLRTLAEAIGAKTVVEIGTSVGYSGLWFCLALIRTEGRLITFEIDPQRAAQAKKNFERAGVAERVEIVLGDAHQTVPEKIDFPIDLVFIDADKEGYLDYLRKLLPKVRPGGLIVAHNAKPPQIDPAFLQAITQDPNLETVFLNMDGPGISVSLKKR